MDLTKSPVKSRLFALVSVKYLTFYPPHRVFEKDWRRFVFLA